MESTKAAGTAGKWPRAVPGVENIPDADNSGRGSQRTVAQTMEDVIARRPVLAPVLRAFEPLLSAQAELAEALADALPEDFALTEPWNIQSGSSPAAAPGYSPAAWFDSGNWPEGSAGLLRYSAEKLLPLLTRLEALQPHQAALEAFFLRPADKKTHKKSKESVDPLMLNFVGSFVISPVLRAMTTQLARVNGQTVWEKGADGQEGHCPVCGSLPSIGFLDKPVVDAKNAFLAGGGGKKHLHCGLCGANWKFQRGTCPNCGEKGGGVMEILRESGIAHGERLDWCTKCKTYCPTLDLRECEFMPNLDAAALGMMHLDMVAARKGLLPLKPSFWNIF
ncbi:MAG: formate dehydrogenase accessory protein FdhE [Deltaproteobacteria bacterium]|jgi:FdhE protein|nr:formate dehydrogenase accessory protein FdhE [Deltaproteobacteria bacterium]